MTNGGVYRSPYQLPKLWFKSLFGLFIAAMFYVKLDSVFLAGMALAFFFFIPRHVRNTGVDILNKVFFGFLMLLLLLIAFHNSAMFGLGLDFGIKVTGMSEAAIVGFYVCAAAFVLISAFYTGRKKVAPTRLSRAVIGLFIVSIAVGMGTGVFRIWDWNDATIVFFVIWVLAFISGYADTNTRQGIGVVIIIVSFFIYSAGVGGQNVGSAVFGYWWPPVHNFFSSAFKPIGQAWSQLRATLGNAWMLFSNPVGWTQQMMNGTYTRDPDTGLRGAYGVELEEIRVTPIYAEQPFTILVKINNKGAYPAKNVKVGVSTWVGDIPEGPYYEQKLKTEDIGIKPDNNPGVVCPQATNECYFEVVSGDVNLTKMDIRQLLFNANGISCYHISEHGLRDRYIPIHGTVEYDYGIESVLMIEAMNQSEWERLAREGRLKPERKEASQFTNAPVRLNLDAPDQPVREGSSLQIGFHLVSAKGKNSEILNASVTLEVPKSFAEGITPACTVKPKSEKGRTTGDPDMVVFEWENLKGPYVVYCNFGPMKLTNKDAPTQTYLVRATSSYRFKEWEITNTGIDFRGITCCEIDADCPFGQKCEQATRKCGAGTVEQPKGAPDYCDWINVQYENGAINHKCMRAEGGCKRDEQCDQQKQYDADSDGKLTRLKCWANIANGVCCPEDDNTDNCTELHEEWKAGNYEDTFP